MADALFRVTVPAKAMLWGEYGVLVGGPAVVVSIPQINFVCEVYAAPKSVDDVALTVCSDFLDGGQLCVTRSHLQGISDQASRDLRFFAGACAPWSDVFGRWSLTLNVSRAFSPSLGFGSSSALLAALHRSYARLMWGTSAILDKPLFWNRVFDSLGRIQGGGSGYDVAVQSETLWFDEDVGIRETRVWKYERGENLPKLDVLDVPDLSKFGVFVASHVYSDTSHALSTYAKGETCALAHADIARDFLREPSIACLSQLMERSRAVARAQGILPALGDDGEFAQVCTALDALGLPWKHMGSGKGDCLWVAASRHELTSVAHPITKKMISNEIAFDFSAKRGY